MGRTAILQKINKLEKDVKDLKKIALEEAHSAISEEKKALEAAKIFEREKKAGKLKVLSDPKILLK